MELRDVLRYLSRWHDTWNRLQVTNRWDMFKTDLWECTIYDEIGGNADAAGLRGEVR
jgi:hypothetical protein